MTGAPVKPKRVMHKWTPEQLEEMYARREVGETLASLGISFGVTGERIRQLVAKVGRQKRRLSN